MSLEPCTAAATAAKANGRGGGGRAPSPASCCTQPYVISDDDEEQSNDEDGEEEEDDDDGSSKSSLMMVETTQGMKVFERHMYRHIKRNAASIAQGKGPIKYVPKKRRTAEEDLERSKMPRKFIAYKSSANVNCKGLRRASEDSVELEVAEHEEEEAEVAAEPVTEAEVIEINSVSSKNRNTQLKSKSSSSEFAVSSSSKIPPKRPKLKKNTVDEDKMDKLFDNIGTLYPQLTFKEKIDDWDCSSQFSEVEDVKSFKEDLIVNAPHAPVVSSELGESSKKAESPKKRRSEKSREKPATSVPPRQTRQSMKTALNEKLSQMHVQNHEEVLCVSSDDSSKTAPPMNLIWSDEESVFKRNRQNPEIDKMNYMLKMAAAAKSAEIFKIPNIPQKYLQQGSDLNQERFCKILGLETKMETNQPEGNRLIDFHRAASRNPKIKIICSFSYSECNSTTANPSTDKPQPPPPPQARCRSARKASLPPTDKQSPPRSDGVKSLSTSEMSDRTDSNASDVNERPLSVTDRIDQFLLHSRDSEMGPLRFFEEETRKNICIVDRVDYNKENITNLPDVVPLPEPTTELELPALPPPQSPAVVEELPPVQQDNPMTAKPKPKPKSTGKRKNVWSKRKMKIFRSANFNQKILRNRKIIKIISNHRPIVVKKRPRKRSESDKSISLFSPAKVVEEIVAPAIERISNDNLPAVEMNIPFELKSLNTTCFPINPLKFESGEVLYAYYENETLIVVQTLSISFWKYCRMMKILGGSSEWIFLNECSRRLEDEEITTPYKNRLCTHESTTVYIEMRARELSSENRICHMSCIYVNVYYFDKDTEKAVRHSINLDSVKCLPSEVNFTTIPESRYFVMSWKQECAMGKSRTGLCKYSLTPDLETLASIREFKQMRHSINYLDCINDDKLIGFGETQITVWDHRTGDVLVNFDLEMNLGTNLSSIYYSSDNDDIENSLILFQMCNCGDQQNDNEDSAPELKIFTISVSENSSYRLIYNHELPSSFQDLKSYVNTGDYVIISSVVNEEIWIASDEPKCLTYFNRPNTKRFYSNLNSKFIEITEDTLTVETLLNNLLKIVKL